MKARRLLNSAALAVLLLCCNTRRDPLPAFPRLVLWAWERPEDLRFIDPQHAAVAVLTRTAGWSDGQMRTWPRMQPLRVAPGTHIMAVVRLESHGSAPPADAVAMEILRDAARPAIEALQIDFDARASERQWYASLLRRLRARMRPGMPLTITALASWCESDAWIRDLPARPKRLRWPSAARDTESRTKKPPTGRKPHSYCCATTIPKTRGRCARNIGSDLRLRSRSWR